MDLKQRNDMLVRIDERTKSLVEWTNGHIELHNKLSLAFISAVVSTFLALSATVVSLILAIRGRG
jgi:hypothetical protein